MEDVGPQAATQQNLNLAGLNINSPMFFPPNYQSNNND